MSPGGARRLRQQMARCSFHEVFGSQGTPTMLEQSKLKDKVVLFIICMANGMLC